MLATPSDPYSVTWTADFVGQPRLEREYQAPAIDQTVRTVCDRCNSGWMSGLEAAAKSSIAPMILDEGSVHRLSAPEQLTIAAWAVTKAGVAEDLGGTPLLSNEQRDGLRLSQAPPAGSRVHLGRYTGDQGPIKYMRVLGHAPSDHPLEGANAEGVLFIIGRLVIVVLLSPDQRASTPLATGESRPTWVSIWPPHLPSVSWPPSQSVDDSGAVGLIADIMSGVDAEELLAAWRLPPPPPPQPNI